MTHIIWSNSIFKIYPYRDHTPHLDESPISKTRSA